MANKKILVRILVMVLVFGMGVLSCATTSTGGELDPALNGRWAESSSDSFTFNNGNLEVTMNGVLIMKGDYSTNGGKITMKVTQINGSHPEFADKGLERKWYTRADFQKKVPLMIS
jgi:hypothetical protein